MTTFITTHVFIFKCDSFHVLYYFVFIAANYVLVLTILCLGTVFLKICVVCIKIKISLFLQISRVMLLICLVNFTSTYTKDLFI